MWLENLIHLADWGSVPGWIGSLITSGSLVVATATYRKSVRDQRAEQALKVVTWSVEGADDSRTRRVFLANRSNHAIYNVRFTPFDSEDMFFDVFEPGQDFYELPLPDASRLEANSQFSTNMVAVPFVPIKVALSRQQRRQEPYPYLEFVDASGRGWTRDGKGQLGKRSLHGPPRSRLLMTIAGVPLIDVSFQQNDAPPGG